MINISTIFIIIWAHFIGDFLLQSDKMALNKSKSLYWLGIHSSVYGLPFLYFGVEFYFITVGAHFIVDFLSSKLTSHFWITKQRHWFFVVIGWDQAIHFSFLIATIKYLGII